MISHLLKIICSIKYKTKVDLKRGMCFLLDVQIQHLEKYKTLRLFAQTDVMGHILRIDNCQICKHSCVRSTVIKIITSCVPPVPHPSVSRKSKDLSLSLSCFLMCMDAQKLLSPFQIYDYFKISVDARKKFWI